MPPPPNPRALSAALGNDSSTTSFCSSLGLLVMFLITPAGAWESLDAEGDPS
jgi:hypothetical protein